MTSTIDPSDDHSDIATIAPGDSLFVALTRIVDEGVDQLPVVEDGRIVGIVTRADVMRALDRSVREDEPQHGWLASRRRKSAD
jgi:CBS domain-containing protein